MTLLLCSYVKIDTCDVTGLINTQSLTNFICTIAFFNNALSIYGTTTMLIFKAFGIQIDACEFWVALYNGLANRLFMLWHYMHLKRLLTRLIWSIFFNNSLFPLLNRWFLTRHFRTIILLHFDIGCKTFCFHSSLLYEHVHWLTRFEFFILHID